MNNVLEAGIPMAYSPSLSGTGSQSTSSWDLLPSVTLTIERQFADSTGKSSKSLPLLQTMDNKYPTHG